MLDKEEIIERVKEITAHVFGVDIKNLNENTSFAGDYGADQMDRIEFILNAEDEFGIEIPDDEIDNLETIGKFADYLFNNQPTI